MKAIVSDASEQCSKNIAGGAGWKSCCLIAGAKVVRIIEKYKKCFLKKT